MLIPTCTTCVLGYSVKIIMLMFVISVNFWMDRKSLVMASSYKFVRSSVCLSFFLLYAYLVWNVSFIQWGMRVGVGDIGKMFINITYHNAT